MKMARIKRETRLQSMPVHLVRTQDFCRLYWRRRLQMLGRRMEKTVQKSRLPFPHQNRKRILFKLGILARTVIKTLNIQHMKTGPIIKELTWVFSKRTIKITINREHAYPPKLLTSICRKNRHHYWLNLQQTKKGLHQEQILQDIFRL